ncbi:MAG: CRISPR system precrRNA processing endoribonuclease RAMP protein Cas6 [Anaerolineales bacterium]|nr:CRISPR system precrRNA processing endoribonuclease RAMP protein Cas6 [Anaerolineales bacterium]
MLLSSVIHLKALEGGALPQYVAPALRAEFLNWIGARDKPASDQLHDGNESRPYTVSDLKGTFHAQRGFNLVEAGQSAWFRATSLTDAQTRMLESVCADVQGKMFTLGHVKFQVTGVAAKHPWAGRTTYSELVEKYFRREHVPETVFEMEFASPTAFRDDGLRVPFAAPELAFRFWLRRWNKFSQASLPQAVKDIKQARVILSRYQLGTSVFHYEGEKWIGFLGRCHYRVLADDEFWARLCGLLTDFAFFCGTGKSTTFGMGQTRRV